MVQLREGWEAAWTAPDRCSDPSALDGLEWLPARVPGTAAAVLADAGLWRPGDERDLDAEDWWFRTRFDATGEDLALHVDGIATVAEVFLNGERILESSSMFASHVVDVGARLRDGGNELAIRCRALGPLLAAPRKPRARWRTRLVDGNLRWYRTMLLGRARGIAPGPAAVGPWRPVSLERRRPQVELRTRIDGDDGVVTVRGATFAGGETELRIAGAERWWPHTHGEPKLYAVELFEDGESVDTRHVGFRELSATDPEQALELTVNGVSIFARGAVWTPVDFVSLAPSPAELCEQLERVRDAGMNVVRVVGTAHYESRTFYDLCDELGLLVWQDFMFANLDYPIGDDSFRELVEGEARAVLGEIAWRPSTVVLCGNSEVEQQVAMLGLDPALGRGELFGELLPRLAREAGADAVYVPSAPCGGELPFRPDAGVAHYFGVGGYRRGLDDVRRADVKFAAECLAFSNLPNDEAAVAQGVPRDVGADWDFADVRDHYLHLLYADGSSIEAAHSVTGEVMAEVFGEWRRAASSCAGGIVLWLRDIEPGAGWGVLGYEGRPKVAYHHLRRALAPVAVWTTDEGLNGVDVHVANDRQEPLVARLRVALYRDLEVRVEEAEEEVELAPHTTVQRNVEEILGRFVDAAYAYRFGPPGHDAIVVSLEDGDGLLSQSVRFTLARPPVSDLGLEATLRDGQLAVRTRRLAYGVRVHVPGSVSSDDAFCVEPGRERIVELRPPGSGWLTAVNLDGRVEFE
jgi:beta-mannosidase